MTRRSFLFAAALGCSALAPRPAAADDKDKPAPAGTWVRKEGELKLEFVDKGVLRISPHGDKEAFTVVCSYTAAKGGRVTAKITDLEGKAELTEKAKNVVPVGSEFSFQWRVKDGTATLDDLKGEKVDALKAHLEGDFEAKK